MSFHFDSRPPFTDCFYFLDELSNAYMHFPMNMVKYMYMVHVYIYVYICVCVPVYGTYIHIYVYTTTLRYNVHTARCSDIPHTEVLSVDGEVAGIVFTSTQFWELPKYWGLPKYCQNTFIIIFCLRILIWFRLHALAKDLVRFLGLWVNIYLWILFSFNLKIMGGQAFTLSEGQSGQ